jgi:hypothetical protein
MLAQRMKKPPSQRKLKSTWLFLLTLCALSVLMVVLGDSDPELWLLQRWHNARISPWTPFRFSSFVAAHDSLQQHRSSRTPALVKHHLSMLQRLTATTNQTTTVVVWSQQTGVYVFCHVPPQPSASD